MINYDLIVLIPWAIVSIVFVLICIRLQASSRKSQSPAQSAGRAHAMVGGRAADGAVTGDHEKANQPAGPPAGAGTRASPTP